MTKIRYASQYDFENPFFVIVHENYIDLQNRLGNISEEITMKLKHELNEIKSKYEYTIAGPLILADVSKKATLKFRQLISNN
jgi:hypothetical protein